MAIEKSLARIGKIWAGTAFTFFEYRPKVFMLTNSNKIFELIENCLVALQVCPHFAHMCRSALLRAALCSATTPHSAAPLWFSLC